MRSVKDYFNSALFIFPPSKSLAILLHTMNLKEKMFEFDMMSTILLNLIRRGICD